MKRKVTYNSTNFKVLFMIDYLANHPHKSGVATKFLEKEIKITFSLSNRKLLRNDIKSKFSYD